MTQSRWSPGDTLLVRTVTAVVLMLAMPTALAQVAETDQERRCWNYKAALTAMEKQLADSWSDEQAARARNALATVRRELDRLLTDRDLDRAGELEVIATIRAIGKDFGLPCSENAIVCIFSVDSALDERIAAAVGAKAEREAREKRAASFRTGLAGLDCGI